VLRAVQTAIVGLAGLAGLLVVAAALAPLAGLHLVRLETGSMAPTLPAGSVLLLRDVAGREVSAGDVVTVARPGHSPVTHRVVEAVPAGEGARLVLRGDANGMDDPEPYLVDRVGLLVAGVPLGGGLLAALGTPAGMIAVSLAASLLVLWSWWPQRRPRHRAEPPPRRRRMPAHRAETAS